MYKVIFFLLFFPFVNNNSADYKSTIYDSYVLNDLSPWKNVINSIEKNNPEKLDEKLELLSYYYGYTAYCLDKESSETVEALIERAEKHIDDVIKISPENATVYAYKASFLGYRIVLSKFKALFLAPESYFNISKAMDLDSKNTQALIDKGNVLAHAPRFFGGDKKQALVYFQSAIDTYEKNKDIDENWLYLSIIILKARTYIKLERYQEAKKCFDKVLLREPKHKLVSTEYYPDLLKKMQ